MEKLNRLGWEEGIKRKPFPRLRKIQFQESMGQRVKSFPLRTNQNTDFLRGGLNTGMCRDERKCQQRKLENFSEDLYVVCSSSVFAADGFRLLSS